MSAGNKDLTRANIRLKGDMIGVCAPGLNPSKLLDAETAFSLGLNLTRLGHRLQHVYDSAKRDADLRGTEVEIDPAQAKEEYKAFIFEAMLSRLGINAEEDHEVSD